MVNLCNLCRKPQIIKNKYVSSLIGTICIYLSISFILPVGNFSVYITSYININQEWVTMHYGTYFSLILTFSMTFSRSFGGLLENKMGFMLTTQFGLAIVLVANIFFFNVQNIWICYILICIMGIGCGIATSLLAKNLAFYNPTKKGRISGIIGILTVVLAAIFAFLGEKVINSSGESVNEKKVYPKEIAEKTYIFYLSGFFSLPVGGFLGFLFLYEYKREDDPTQYLRDVSDKQKELNEVNEAEEALNPKTNPEEEIVANINNSTEEEKEKEKAEKNFEKEVDKIKSKKHIKQVLKSWRFWRISISSLLLNFPVMFMVNTGRIFGAIIGINATILQLMSIFQAFGIVLIGPILGYISDKKNPLVLLRIVTLICVLPGIILNLFLENSFMFLLSVLLYIFGLVGNMVGSPPLIMEIYGIQESVILGSFLSTFAKVSEIITTTVAFFVSFIYQGNSIRIPYKIIYVLSALFSYLSFYLLMVEEMDKQEYDDSEVEVEPTPISRESILSNL